MALSTNSKEKDLKEEEEEKKEIDDAENSGEEENDEQVIEDEDASEEIDDGEEEEEEEEEDDEEENKITADRKWKAEEDNEDQGEEEDDEENEEEELDEEEVKGQEEKESEEEGNDNDEDEEEDEEDENENQEKLEGEKEENEEDEEEEHADEEEDNEEVTVQKNKKKSKTSKTTKTSLANEQNNEKKVKEDGHKEQKEVTQESDLNLKKPEVKDQNQEQTVKEKEQLTKENSSEDATQGSNLPKGDISSTNSEKLSKEQISKEEEAEESTQQEVQGKTQKQQQENDTKAEADNKLQSEKDSNELKTQELEKEVKILKPVKIEARPGIIYDAKVDVDNYPGEYSDSGESDEESSGNGESDDDEDDSKIVKKGFSGTTAKKKKQKEEEEKQKKAALASNRRKKQSLVLNVADTKYCVVKFVGKKIFKWRLQNDMEAIDWDICWTDNAVQPDQLGRMQPYQKINHFPGMFSLARKNHLARNLMKMRKNFPKNYQFFPQTWLLPAEFNDFRNHIEKCRPPANTFIAKPEASCQGRGIFLTKTLDDFNLSDHYVVQKYLHNPYLIDGLKFDFRLYVLLAGCDPLRIYLYYEGLTRFATEPYKDPARDNLENMCIHLTNYAINKDNPNFQFNDDKTQMNIGHKRSLTSVLQLLEEKGHDVNTLWKDIKRVLIKTIISAQPTLAHHYRSCQPDNYANNMCFELLGFDIIIDSKLKPWLLEVNHTPSFVTDTPLDGFIKKNAIRDSLKLMNTSCKTKNEIINARKEIMQKRVLTGKKVKYSPEEKIEEVKKAQKKRDEFEDKHLGGFERIFPIEDDEEDNFTEYLSCALKCYEESTGAHIRRNQKKVLEDPKKMPATNQAKLNNPKDLEKIYNSKQPKKAIGPPRCAPGYYRPPTPLDDGTNKNDTKVRGEDETSDSNNPGYTTGQIQRSDSGRVHDFRIKKSNYNSPYNASNSKLKQKMKQQQQNRVAIGVKELRLGEEFIPFEQIQDGKIQSGNYKKISAYMMVTEAPVKVIEKNNKYQSKNDRIQQEKQQFLEQQQLKEQQQQQQNQQLQTQQWLIQQQQQTQMLAYQAQQQQQAQMLTIQAQQITDLPNKKTNYYKQPSQRLPLQPTDNAFTIEDERKQWLASAQRNLQYQLSQQQYQPQQQRLSLIKGPSLFPATNPTEILSNNKDILAAVGGAISGQYKANEKKQIVPSYKQKAGTKEETFKETGTKMFVQQKKFELQGISGNMGTTGGVGDISSGLLLTGKYNKSQDIFMQSKSSNGNYQKML